MLSESEAMIRNGSIRIDEDPSLDLAVVTLPESWKGCKVHQLGLIGAEESQIVPKEFVKQIKTFLTSGDTYVS
jgi:hypothetical protein